MLMLMSAVETGQIAAETGQMPAVETRQMYSLKTGQRPVAIVDICSVSTADMHQNSVSTIIVLWRLRQQPTSG